MRGLSKPSSPSAASRLRRIQLLGIALLLVAMAGGSLWWSNRTYHFATVQDGVLYRSGNHGLTEFEAGVRREHIKTVVSLIDDGELNDPKKPQFRQEEKFLATSGIRQARISVQLGGYPSGEDIKRFLAIVADTTNQPVLVHCAQGVRRTGMFVAAYQESVLGYDKSKAKNAIETFGHSDRVVDDIKAFIDDYDPLKVSVATTRPVTGNE